MPLKLNPYLVEWIVLPEDAGITDEELQRAAAEVIAKMRQAAQSVSSPDIKRIGEPWPAEGREDIAC